MLQVIWKIISSLKKGYRKDFKLSIEPSQTKKFNSEFQIVVFLSLKSSHRQRDLNCFTFNPRNYKRKGQEYSLFAALILL